VVIFLNRLMPLEGGLYQWAKMAFNDFVAFMVAWNLWVFAISILAGIGLVVTTNFSYAMLWSWILFQRKRKKLSSKQPSQSRLPSPAPFKPRNLFWI